MTGYNGAPAGETHCPADESLASDDHCLNSLHAENNAVVQAARNGVYLGSTNWYLWPVGPCLNCQTRFIIPTRAASVAFPEEYADTSRLRIAGIYIDILDR